MNASAVAVDTECENCGMVGEPLVKDDCCAGCVCDRCGKSAFEVGRSMTDMGSCEACEQIIYAASNEDLTPKRQEKP